MANRNCMLGDEVRTPDAVCGIESSPTHRIAKLKQLACCLLESSCKSGISCGVPMPFLPPARPIPTASQHAGSHINLLPRLFRVSSACAHSQMGLGKASHCIRVIAMQPTFAFFPPDACMQSACTTSRRSQRTWAIQEYSPAWPLCL
eukprot:1139227-Pelagomonas_calceolata.AAC.2